MRASGNAICRILPAFAGLLLAAGAWIDGAAAQAPAPPAPPVPPGAPAGAGAPAPAPPLPALKDLLAQGYEVKATMLVPSEVVSRNSRSTVDAVVVTIQRGASIGTCYTAFSAFVDGDFVDLACVVKP